MVLQSLGHPGFVDLPKSSLGSANKEQQLRSQQVQDLRTELVPEAGKRLSRSHWKAAREASALYAQLQQALAGADAAQIESWVTEFSHSSTAEGLLGRINAAVEEEHGAPAEKDILKVCQRVEVMVEDEVAQRMGCDALPTFRLLYQLMQVCRRVLLND